MYCGVFHVNGEEAASLSGKIQELIDRAHNVSITASPEDVITVPELKEIGKFLLSLGPAMVVISLGMNGAFVVTSDKETIRSKFGIIGSITKLEMWANKSVWVPAFKATGPELSAVGAGDAFIGGILAGLMTAKSRDAGIETIIKVGHATALQRVDVQRQKWKLDKILENLNTYEAFPPPNTKFYT